jgi:GH25 family lysozyme M1 (1,4-beta-N-acetylmuramidase)
VGVIRRGIDISNFSGAVTVEQFKELKALGFQWVIPGTQIGLDGMGYTQTQIDNALAAGLDVPGVYELLYWGDRDYARIEHAKSFGRPVWIDCEAEVPPGWLPEHVVSRIAVAVNQLGAQCAGIYTGRWWWVPQTRNSVAFSDLPLWHAEYGVEPFAKFTAYGGWTRPTIWQYADKGPTAVNADLNAWDFVAPAPVDRLTPDIEEELADLRALSYVLGAVSRGELRFVPVRESAFSLTVEARYERDQPGAGFVVRKEPK